ncbi:hypothetical protein V6N11_082105 [Hibiscus sabdariffa]|uniref:Uncharacterized protein n=1 Tax=Hibiscus sabdariffa TaxID=183260 RepID=A0ABR2QH32_9ROSI
MSLVPRAVKRTLKGKNEVCNPIAPKKSKTDSVQFSDWHIDGVVEDGSFPFRFTGIYGSCYRDKKQEESGTDFYCCGCNGDSSVPDIRMQRGYCSLVTPPLGNIQYQNSLGKQEQGKLQAACLGSGICKLCEKEAETILHAVRECPATQEILEISELRGRLPHGPFHTGKDWLEEVQRVLDDRQFQFFLVLIWNVWNRRNRWVHQDQLIPAKLLVEYAQMVAMDTLVVQDIAQSSPQPMDHWFGPFGGVFSTSGGLVAHKSQPGFLHSVHATRMQPGGPFLIPLDVH